MKRPLIITIGILIILLILGLWVYLLLYGAPKGAGEVFTNLGVIPKNEDATASEEATIPNASTQLALNGSELQQLTTKAVAGFAFASSSNDIVRYVEQGTGYIFEINLESQVEKQISLSTLPKTVEAVFSPTGNLVAFISYDEYTTKTTVGVLSDEQTEMQLVNLPDNATNLAFKNENTLYFTLEEGANTVGYTYSISNLASTKLFTVPLTDVRLLWGDTTSSIYAQTKPTKYQEGYVYSIINNTLTPVLSPAYGLVTFVNQEETFITSSVTGDRYTSSILQNGTYTPQAIVMLPEKCVFDNDNSENIWCAAPLTSVDTNYLEDWYKGARTSEDYLWLTHLPTQTSTLIGDLPTLSGRTLDVSQIQMNPYNALLVFSNKIDQTLWLYKIDK